MACWMAACAALPAAAPEHGGPPAAATPQAGPSLSALNPSLPAPDQEGGASSPACTSLLPAAVVPQIVAVLAQITLAHARTTPSARTGGPPPVNPADSAGKVTASRLRRDAYLYIRQSTLYQVANNTESTTRQYDLRGRAVALGWPAERIHVIDIDQGHSGASAADREGFRHLVAEVSMGKAGIVLGLECSRLARNNADWHQLLQICAHNDCLILDEDGLYDPTSFNDRLLLGMKGQLSEAELHFLRSRLRGGILAKARRGELRLQLPIGLVYDSRRSGDPRPRRRHPRRAVSHLFSTFASTGSAFAVVRAFRQTQLTFPGRHRSGPRAGELYWSSLSHDQVLKILHNPAYAGAYSLWPVPPHHRPGRTPPHAVQAGRRLDRADPQTTTPATSPGRNTRPTCRCWPPTPPPAARTATPARPAKAPPCCKASSSAAAAAAA